MSCTWVPLPLRFLLLRNTTRPGCLHMPGLQTAGLSQATRKSRELYVGGLPTPCLDYQLQTFLNQALVGLGLCKSTGKMPIIKCTVSHRHVRGESSARAR